MEVKSKVRNFLILEASLAQIFETYQLIVGRIEPL